MRDAAASQALLAAALQQRQPAHAPAGAGLLWVRLWLVISGLTGVGTVAVLRAAFD
jgi:cytochrome b